MSETHVWYHLLLNAYNRREDRARKVSRLEAKGLPHEEEDREDEKDVSEIKRFIDNDVKAYRSELFYKEMKADEKREKENHMFYPSDYYKSRDVSLDKFAQKHRQDLEAEFIKHQELISTLLHIMK